MAIQDVESGADVGTPPGVDAGEAPTNDAANLTSSRLSRSRIVVLETLDDYEGETITEKVDDCISKLPVVVVTNTYCPFSKDVKQFLGVQLVVKTHVIHINEMEDGDEIYKYLSKKENFKTVPMIYIRGKFIGGCDQLRALHENGVLEKDYLYGLVGRKRTEGTETLETSRLLPPHRGHAVMPCFWFPNVVNNNVVRVTGLQVFILSVLSCAFFDEVWARYIAVCLLIDFLLRFVAGSSLSPLGMFATIITGFWKPDFRPGPPKQFAAFCGVIFSMMATMFYFVHFQYHEIVGAVWIGMLAGASGLEGKKCCSWSASISPLHSVVTVLGTDARLSKLTGRLSLLAFFDFCLGCLFFGYGIQYGIISDQVYRIYTQTRQETIDSWEYQFLDSVVRVPVRVDTDPRSPISLKYKQKCKSSCYRGIA
jgi:glutaredoxin 3